ncbi:MBOAT family protein [Corallococcus coralloides]|nr:MBOAT family protein [Corallococcus coralloides]
MIFNTFAYFFAFLIPSAVLFRLVGPKLRVWVCAVAGISFFIYFSLATPHGVWAASCVLIFIWEASFRRFYDLRSRMCLIGIGISVLMLGAFKYWNFFTGALFLPWDTNPLYWHSAFLPLGISFFTFEFIHYAADRYKGTVERGTLGEYLAFIFFFPTMVAGPIKRFQDFLPCLRSPSLDTARDWNRGVTRILVGLVKKFMLADLLTSVTDHLNRDDILAADRRMLPLWLLAYGWKIYFDFSAYSDIAIGSGRLFGIRIPENFDWPYFRTNITEFWRHWHISLYRWLVDYVFIPLGGSRGSAAFASRNVLIVMLVSGLWHGAGLNFLVWGLWHGMLLVIHREWRRRRPLPEGERKVFHQAVARLSTYLLVNIGWAFFAMDLPTAGVFFRRLVVG